MRTIGIDIGSTYTKYCMIDGDQDACGMEFFSERTPVQQKEYLGGKLEELRRRYGDCPVVSCGYGRRNVPGAAAVTELTALAKGAGYCCLGSRIILDIGGQDTKLVVQEGGKLKEFFLNDRCAAGSGLFLGNVLNLLGIGFREIDLTRDARPEVRLSSVCAVFAQSEIVELVAEGVPGMAIVHGVLEQVLTQAKALLGKTGSGPVTLSGGLTSIPGIGRWAERIWGREVLVPEHGAYLSAAGCALLAQGKGFPVA